LPVSKRFEKLQPCETEFTADIRHDVNAAHVMTLI
jgi:hypothetical protein